MKNGSAATRRVQRIARAAKALDVALLEGSLGYMLRRAQLATFAEFGKELEALGLRPGQFGVLAVIGRNPGVTQSEICTALGIQRPNFVAVIDELEGRGLAKRGAAAYDRRANALSLTPAGRRVLERAELAQRAHEARLAARLGPGGQERLLALLSRLVESGRGETLSEDR